MYKDDNNQFRYCGKYYDTESGYTYLQARYYDAGTGRFISEDPAWDGDNWYIYCRNNLINMVDPTGCLCFNLTNSREVPYAYWETRKRLTNLTNALQYIISLLLARQYIIIVQFELSFE